MKHLLLFLLLQIPLAVGASAQITSSLIPWTTGSGAQTAPSSHASMVWADRIVIPGATSLQVRFGDVTLGTGDRLVVRSTHDGHAMDLDRATLSRFGGRSAWFNGDTVIVELHLGAGSHGEAAIDGLYAHLGSAGGGDGSACPSPDPRTPLTDDRICRFVRSNSTCAPLGSTCVETGWRVATLDTVISVRQAQTAGVPNIAQFRVPPSDPVTGAPVHPAPEDQFPIDVSTIELSSGTLAGNDFSIVSLQPNALGQTAFQRYGIGLFPAATLPGIGASVSSSGHGADTTPDISRNHTLQQSTGAILSINGTEIVHDIDGDRGIAGAPLIDTNTGEVIGITSNIACASPLAVNTATAIINATLQGAIFRQLPCPGLSLTQAGSATIAGCSGTRFTTAAIQGFWNVVAVSSPSDFDVRYGGAAAETSGTQTDFLVADGNAGPFIDANPGWAYSGSGGTSATLTALATQNRSTNVLRTVDLRADAIMAAIAFDVTTPGTYRLDTSAPAFGSVRWALIPPQPDGTWSEGSSLAIANGTSGLSRRGLGLGTGKHLVVFLRDGGPSGQLEQLRVSLCQDATFRTLTAGTPEDLLAACESFAFTPSSGRWHAIAAATRSFEWQLLIDGELSVLDGTFGAARVLVADGTSGAVPAGDALFFGNPTSGGTAQLATGMPLALDRTFSGQLGAREAVALHEVSVTTPGLHRIAFDGTGSLRWTLFRPDGTATWRDEGTAISSGTAPGGASNVILDVPGTWCIAVLHDGSGPALTRTYSLRVLTDPTVIPLTNASGSTAITGLARAFSVTPSAGTWNLLAVQSQDDWDLSLGGARAATRSAPGTDLLIADGQAGIVSGGEGSAERFAGAATSANLQFDTPRSTLLPGGSLTETLGASTLARLVTLDVGVAGSYDLVVQGSSGVFFEVFTRSVDARWVPSSIGNRRAAGPVPQSLSLPAGQHALLIGRDGPLGATESVTISLTAFVAQNPVPTLSSLFPPSVPSASSQAFVSVFGVSFVPGAVITIDGTPVPTGFAGSEEVVATIPANQLLTPRSAVVQVINPAPGGGPATSTLTLDVLAPLPFLGSLTPDRRFAGPGVEPVRLQGAGFSASSTVLVDSVPQAAIFIDENTLDVVLSGPALQTPGTLMIQVINPGPGGGASAPLIFEVLSEPIILTSLNPPSVPVNSPAITLTVNGSGFTPTAQIVIDGSAVSTTFVSSSALETSLTAAQLSVGGSFTIEVVDPASGSLAGNLLQFDVIDPRVRILEVRPNRLPVLGPNDTVQILIVAQNIDPQTQVHANSDLLPSIQPVPGFLAVSFTASAQAMTQVNGNLALSLVTGSGETSNIVVLPIGNGFNQGVISRDPIAPSAGDAFDLVLSGGATGQPFSLIFDLDPLASTSSLLQTSPTSGVSLNVRPFAPPQAGTWSAAIDGIGLYRQPEPNVVFGATGPPADSFRLRGLFLPPTPLGVTGTLQAVYLDPAAAGGFNVTWARHADRY